MKIQWLKTEFTAPSFQFSSLIVEFFGSSLVNTKMDLLISTVLKSVSVSKKKIFFNDLCECRQVWRQHNYDLVLDLSSLRQTGIEPF